MLILGITGGSGSGKSAVSKLLEELGAVSIDADEVYHELLKSSEAMLRSLKKRFPDCIRPNGNIDRKALAATVFSDKAALADLNEITHKFVIEKIEQMISEFYRRNMPCVCIDAISLFESGLNSLCEVTIGVIASRDKRISRIIERDGIDKMAACARINAQPEDNFYIENCDYTVKNNGNLEDITDEVTAIFEAAMKG